jgi:hypothetical protein
MKTTIVQTKYNIRDGQDITSYVSFPGDDQEVEILKYVKDFLGKNLREISITIKETNFAS